MNRVELIGRLTRDPEVRYTADSNMAVATFTLAVDRVSKEKRADFPRIKVFGKQAENVEKYMHKGSQIAIEGSIETGSYKDKDGGTHYTTDVVASRVEFLGRPEKKEVSEQENFEELDEDVPF